MMCFNTDCFRFDKGCGGMSCLYTSNCNGHQISATKQMFKEINEEVVEEWAKETVMKVAIIFVDKASPRQIELAKGIIHNAMKKLNTNNSEKVVKEGDKIPLKDLECPCKDKRHKDCEDCGAEGFEPCLCR